MKRLWIFIFILLLLLVFCQILLQSAKSALSPIVYTTSCPENVTIYFLDVGQGDSILVKTPSKSVLIDGGPTSAGTAVLNDLNEYNVTKIDLMVATHPHADHIGGLISVLQSTIPVQDIVYNGYNYTATQTFTTWKSLALTHNLTQGNRNQVYAISPTINFTVISPTNPTQFGSTDNDINANSIVMKLQVGNTSVLLTGDAQFDSEQSMLSSGYNLHSQVLKVGHHGSSTSTSQAFLSAITPTYAVISAGIDNPYGHPSQQTLDTLTSNSIITYGTYNYGTIIFSLNSASSTPSPTLTPTPSPTSTPTSIPTPSPTATPDLTTRPTLTAASTQAPTIVPTQNPTGKPNMGSTASPSRTASVPEFSTTLAIVFFVATVLAIALASKRNQLRGKLTNKRSFL